ncbi:DUF1810 domain-containing protein [Halorubrum sp. Atlit-28R]|uniref:DUF1810 domain-containing protein n=1 Tax=Halorubrum sp. Atlit-28R TaxID=2282129 RepID=UPI000EF1D5BC|nr:DUF1810 family protein [Halorubrum sp. Atlit-28R]RLM50477.1 DUF1810 family protein [Halorubrum sp. Atlit-28R]
MAADDPRDLERFLDAQDGVIEAARRELRSERKRGHRMRFVFAQVEGVGSGRTSRRYAIGSREEAAAYLAHPTLGPQLRECTAIGNGTDGRTAREVSGAPDALNFRSWMTLFDAVADGSEAFGAALDRYYDERDEGTLRFLREE